MRPSADEARRLLCQLGEHVRALVADDRGLEMSDGRGGDRRPTRSTPSTVSPTTRCWAGSSSTGPTVRVVSEGLDEPVVVGATPAWTVIVDTIDGTRGLMYDKRPAWCLAAAAPVGGSLHDIVAAAMTELPTVEAGCGRPAERRPRCWPGGRAPPISAVGDMGHVSRSARRRPRTSSTASAGWPSSSLPGSPHSLRSKRSSSADSVVATCSTTSTSPPGASSMSSSRAATASSPTSARWSWTTPVASPAIPTTSAPPCC